MESQPIGKRKKRRTRKCLDELRKRSRANYSATRYLESKHNLLKFKNNCVTLNRLTLNLFPKAVRSETITRPILAEIKNNPNSMLDNLVKVKKVNISCSSDGKILEISNIDAHNSMNTEMEVSYSLKTITYNEGEQDDKSSDSYFLFSPIHQTEVKDPIKVSSAPVTAPCSQDNYGYSVYREFMNEISTYLKQTSSDLFNENVIDRNKVLLQSLFLNQNNKQKCENNIVKCLKTNVSQKSYTPSETIIQNPVDYIRKAQVGYTSIGIDHRREHSESLSDSTSTPNTQFSTHTNLSTSIVIYETPEYIYYPHKLNQ